jgi:hypothetical protein
MSDLVKVDDGTTAKVVESVVTKGDISGLTPVDKSRYYVQMCESLGLNPAAQPFAVLKLSGKEVLYASRGATDQLAAIHKLNREIIDGPKVVDLEGAKIVYCLARATHPNGRTETSVATLPFSDPANVLMKAETKAKRRATLSILGLGMLDESELETIPASAKAECAQVSVVPPLDPPAAQLAGPEPQLSPVQEVIHTLRYHLGDSGITPLVAAAAWVEHEGVLSADDLAELFEELHKCLPAGISKATLQHSIVIERLAAKCLKIESLEELEYLIIGQYAQRQSLPLKVRPLWDKELAKHAERLGCKTPIEWVRAICDHDEPTPPPGKPQPTPPPAPTTVAGTATETERASLDGLRVSLATKSKSGDPAYAIGCAFAKRRSVLGRHLAEGRALTIDALLPHCAGDEAQANARLDGICREWDSKQGRRAA